MAKKRERTMSIEEMRVKVKSERTAYWHHSAPLFGLIKSPQGFQFVPVAPDFESKVYLLFFLDPSDIITRTIFELMEHFGTRYKSLPWKAVMIFHQNLPYTKNPNFWESYKRLPGYSATPIFFDYFNEFQAWIKAGTRPKLFWFNRGKLVEQEEITENPLAQILNIEQKLQNFLRETDRGLPLPLLYEYDMEGQYDKVRLTPGETTRTGHWSGNPNLAISTEDQSATMTVPFEGRTLRFLANLHTQAREDSRVIVTLNDRPLTQGIAGKHVTLDPHGGSIIEVDRITGTFDIIQAKETVKGIVKLEFKFAAVNPIFCYGLRLG